MTNSTLTYPKNIINITSKANLDLEFKRIKTLFAHKETEETWSMFNQALQNITAWSKVDEVINYTSFKQHINDLQIPINNCLKSPRSTLSWSAMEMLEAIAAGLKEQFTDLNDLFYATIFNLFGGRSSKTQVDRCLRSYLRIIRHSKLTITIKHVIKMFKQNKLTNESRNHGLSAGLASCLNQAMCVSTKDEIVKAYSGDIEQILWEYGQDRQSSVREKAKACHKTLCLKLPQDVDSINDRLPDVVKKIFMVRLSPSASSSTSTTSASSSSTSTSQRKSPKVAATTSQKAPLQQKSLKRKVVDEPVDQSVSGKRKLFGESYAARLPAKSRPASTNTTPTKRKVMETTPDTQQPASTKRKVATATPVARQLKSTQRKLIKKTPATARLTAKKSEATNTSTAAIQEETAPAPVQIELANTVPVDIQNASEQLGVLNKESVCNDSPNATPAGRPPEPEYGDTNDTTPVHDQHESVPSKSPITASANHNHGSVESNEINASAVDQPKSAEYKVINTVSVGPSKSTQLDTTDSAPAAHEPKSNQQNIISVVPVDQSDSPQVESTSTALIVYEPKSIQQNINNAAPVDRSQYTQSESTSAALTVQQSKTTQQSVSKVVSVGTTKYTQSATTNSAPAIHKPNTQRGATNIASTVYKAKSAQQNVTNVINAVSVGRPISTQPGATNTAHTIHKQNSTQLNEIHTVSVVSQHVSTQSSSSITSESTQSNVINAVPVGRPNPTQLGATNTAHAIHKQNSAQHNEIQAVSVVGQHVSTQSSSSTQNSSSTQSSSSITSESTQVNVIAAVPGVSQPNSEATNSAPDKHKENANGKRLLTDMPPPTCAKRFSRPPTPVQRQNAGLASLLGREYQHKLPSTYRPNTLHGTPSRSRGPTQPQQRKEKKNAQKIEYS